MKFSRNFAVKINFILNEILPPIIRDSKWLFYLPMKLLFKNNTNIFINFRANAHSMTDKQYRDIYSLTSNSNLLKNTDLNKQSIERIINEIKGINVLEIGCGRGFLTNLLSENNSLKLTATDINIAAELKKNKKVTFIKAQVDKLPFFDNQFDTVICTHVLEHVLNIELALNEIRRVTSKKIIIIIPRERPYKFGFNLHLNFFPYKSSVMKIIAKDGEKTNIKCELINQDWFYVENIFSKSNLV